MPVVDVKGQLYDFQNITSVEKFDPPGFSRAIYAIPLDKLWEENVRGVILDEKGASIEENLKLYQWSLFRLLKLQAKLSSLFVGYEEQIQMLFACAIAQEPVLFVGRPGVAKTELATSFFGGIGLRKPQGEANPKDGETNKYFEYLLSPYTIPEELFGPLNYPELEKGTVARINTNMVTGKLVRGVFLDEIFNASSSILNTLLTLINERRYFDRGMFQDADLRVFIGASNRTPAGKYGSGDGMGSGKSGELEAFYDRFTMRLYLPTPQELHESQPDKILQKYKEIDNITRDRFMERLTMERPAPFKQVACMNDILLLGRVLGKIPFNNELENRKNEIVTGLAMSRSGRNLCLMSPRKPNKLRPIMLADSLLLDVEGMHTRYRKEHKSDANFKDVFTTRKILEYIKGKDPRVEKDNLRVFYHIWDYEGDRSRLKEEVNVMAGIK
jgi:MoxR-like ATPase